MQRSPSFRPAVINKTIPFIGSGANSREVNENLWTFF